MTGRAASRPLLPNTGDQCRLAELHARHARELDIGDADAWAECFTPDGTLRTSAGRTVKGTAEPRSFASSWWDSRTGSTRHITWHRTYEVDEASIRGLCCAALLVTRENGVTVEFTAMYVDTFVQRQGTGCSRHVR